MLSILKALFGKTAQGAYPDSLVKQAIERTIDATDPWIRSVSGYGKKLRPSVVRAIDYVVNLVDAFPPPIPVNFSRYNDDPVLKRYFISAKELRDIFSRDPALAAYMQGDADGSERFFALMAMEKQERVVFGAALSGDIVIKDVPMVTVSFDGHRLVDPNADEALNRRSLKIRAFDHLLSLALKRLVFVKSERGDLERRHALLQAKLDLFSRHGLGFGASSSDEEHSPEVLEKQLDEIEAQQKALGGDSGESVANLEIVANLMGNPEQYLLARNETMLVNQLGVKQTEPASDVYELRFTELHNAEGRSLVVMPVTLETAEVRSLLAGPPGRMP